jgi:hypothetical protein
MEKVNEFLDLLERIVEGNNLNATRIYNFDELAWQQFRRILEGRNR